MRAIDLAENIGDPAIYNFTVSDDTTAPDTTLLETPPARTNDDFATFTFESNDPTATFECNLDNQGFEECFNPAQYVELEPGMHTFEVRAVDLSLNADRDAGRAYTWTYELDDTPPVTTIHTYPTNPSLVPNANFTFGAVGPEIEYECQIDNEPFESCESPMLYEELTAGTHTFRVFGTDFFGNVETTPATYTWVQAVNPLVTARQHSGGSERGQRAHVHVLVRPAGTFECRLSGAMFVNWTAAPRRTRTRAWSTASTCSRCAR